MEIKGALTMVNKCHAYFKGRDGRGTCDTGCQWYRDGYRCPMTVLREKWDTEEDPFNPPKIK